MLFFNSALLRGEYLPNFHPTFLLPPPLLPSLPFLRNLLSSYLLPVNHSHANHKEREMGQMEHAAVKTGFSFFQVCFSERSCFTGGEAELKNQNIKNLRQNEKVLIFEFEAVKHSDFALE